jgi:ADP-ribose pyrophosphatase YjhB (NUDIX family)
VSKGYRHIDLVYVLRATATDLTAQLDEVSSARWVPLNDVGTLETPTELPELVAAAARWASLGEQRDRVPGRLPAGDTTRAGPGS